MFVKVSNDEEILKTHSVMSELRPQCNKPESYLEIVKGLMANSGYLLAYIEDGGQVKSVAGYRFGESLAWGKYIYIDDLVTTSSSRSKGYGKRLLDCLLEEARNNQCQAIHLDSGVQRHSAHRFYLRERMDIVFYHFRRDL